MTLPTTTTVNGCDDDSDMFGPPRSSPIGYHHHRSRVPMISPKLRQREERKRILQLCAHKLERIKDSETNLRRSVCINNTYCRLTDELRREKQSRYLANLPRSEVKPESARDNIFNPYNSCGIDNSNYQPSNKSACNEVANSANNNNALNNVRTHSSTECELVFRGDENNLNCSNSNKLHSSTNSDIANSSSLNGDVINANNNSTTTANISHATANHSTANNASSTATCTHNSTANSSTPTHTRKRQLCSSNLDNDLEILDRELSEINAPMPLIDPEITQGAEQLEKAISSRKRLRSEDESDRLVREALSQFYIPQQRLISAIEDCPLDVVSVGGGMGVGVGLGLGMGVGMGMGPMSPSKRQKLGNGTNELELEFDLNQNQKDFEVIMDALRLGTPSPTPSVGSDSCGQAAMMSESASVFHNLVVTSLET
ncbi:uncharacterized protein DDB_G0288805 [Zeugodacus cucurbitae]|uniref:SERTA domain-containing protein n=1 Tax=Zeugodacus cucurbitae TaxID=28588 RepID=A0A0A1XSD2_ZEUCU|nr:uncharacterized protein DDB_G0288805 [Zeugodacus cucurbitae]